MNPTDPRHLPTLSLDPQRKDEILEQILTVDAPTVDAHHRRRWVAPAAAAAAVAAIATGGVTLLDSPVPDDGQAATTTPSSTTATPTSTSDATTPYTLGPLSAAQSAQASSVCARELDLAPDAFTTVHAQRVQGQWERTSAVVIEDSVTGTALACVTDVQSSMIAGPNSKTVVVEPTATRPVVAIDRGATSSTVEADGTLSAFDLTIAFRAHPEVARIEMRVGTETAPGTWHVSEPAGGYAFVGAWLEVRVPEDTDLFVETRAFDTNGDPIAGGTLGRVKTHAPAAPRLRD